MTETPQPDSLVQASAEAGAVTVPWDDLPADPTIQVKPPAPGAGVPEPEAMATGSGTPGLATGSGTPGYGARNERQPGGPDTVAKPETPAPPQETPEAEPLSEDDITTAPVPPPPGAHSSRVFPGDGPGVLWQAGEDADQTQPMAPPDPTLVVGATCAECGGVIDQDGYCTQCGARARSARDHYTLTPADWVAGACDIGLYHRRNEDALAAEAGPTPGERAVLVVCDGVTTSQDSDRASLAGAQAACAALWQSPPQGLEGVGESHSAALAQALRDAVKVADEAVIAATAPDSLNPASATFAAGVIEDRVLYWANLGDSRVYWFPDGAEPLQLSEDHSLAQAQIDEGVAREEAEASVLAHTITRWLGRDATDLEPGLGEIPLSTAGWVLVCSDGLWNYASEPTALAEVLKGAVTPGAAIVDVANGLVGWANGQGGHDNITVALARLEQPPGSGTLAS